MGTTVVAALVLAFAASGSASAAVTVPGAPRQLTAVAGDGQVTLNWGASSAEPAGYYVWRRTPDGAWSVLATTPVSTLTYTDSAAANGVGYTYGIRAVNDRGVSASSSLVTVAPAPASLPARRCGTSTSAYQRLISSTPGLRGYWRLGDGGATACEVTGRNDGIYRGGFTLGAGAGLSGDQDRAAKFDGYTGSVSVPDSQSLSLGNSFTAEAWVKRGSLGGGNQVIVSKQNGSWVLMFDGRDRLVLRRSNVGDVATSTVTVADTGRWHHVAATKSGGSVHLYLDGTDVTGPVTNQTMVENLKPLAIGQSSDSAYFRGSIDEVAVYDGALTAAQIADRYRRGADPVIAAAGDTACSTPEAQFNGGLGTANACRQRYTADLLAGANLAAVLPLGDGQHWSGTLSEYRGGYDPTWGRVKAISRPIAGNHDYDTPGASGYFDYFNGPGVAAGPAGERGKGWYSWDIGDWHMVALNSECAQIGGCGAGSPQEQWLRADLAAHPARCTLAYWHRPLVSSAWTGNTPEMRQIWQDLYEAGADVVLTAHSHTYERFAPQDAAGVADAARGIREFVVGTGGQDHHALGMIQPNTESVNATAFGVLKLALHTDGYDWQFVPETGGGGFTDSGSGACH